MEVTALLNQVLQVVNLKPSVRKFYGRPHDLVNRYRSICITNDHCYVLFVVITVRLIHDLSLGL